MAGDKAKPVCELRRRTRRAVIRREAERLEGSEARGVGRGEAWVDTRDKMRHGVLGSVARSVLVGRNFPNKFNNAI